MAVTAGPESIRIIMKLASKNWTYQLSDDFLSHPASNRRNAERSKFAIVFGNIYPFKRDRLIGASFEVFHETIQISFEITLEHLYRDFIKTCCAPVPFNGFKGLYHHFRVILPVREWTLNFLGTIFTADSSNILLPEVNGYIEGVFRAQRLSRKRRRRPIAGLHLLS
jgi:hypothetical protein